MVVRELINLIGFKIDDKKLKDTNKKFDKIKRTARNTALALGAAIISIGAVALKTAINMEALNAQFEVMLGNAEKATVLTNQLIEFAKKTPFRLEHVAQGTKTLLSFGATQEEILPIMQNLGDIAGGSSEKLKTLALVFGQIKGLGKLQGQDWRQLINVGFNPLQIMAEKTGKSMGQLQKDMSKGLITFDMFRQSLVDITSKGGRFYKNMLRASQTAAGIWSTLQDSFTLALGNAAKEALPQINKIMLRLLPIVENEFGKIAESIIGVLVPILDSLLGIIQPIMSLLVTVFKILTPLLTTVSNIINNTLVPILNELLTILNPILTDFGEILIEIFKVLEPIVSIVLRLLSMMMKRYLRRLGVFLRILKPIFKLLSTILTPFLMALEKVLTLITNIMDKMSELFYIVIGRAIDWIAKKFSGLGDVFKKVFAGISDFFTGIINNVIDGINFLIKGTNKIARTKIELIEKLDTSKLISSTDITNNKQKQTNVNIRNDIKVNGMKNRQQVKATIEKTAGSVFNLQLKKILDDAGGL
jgi:tape measure domain-containing protein